MAAGWFNEDFPCRDGCKHIDCAATRAGAASVCRLCTEPIGYDRRYFVDPEDAAHKALVHEACLEDEVDREVSCRAGEAQREASLRAIAFWGPTGCASLVDKGAGKAPAPARFRVGVYAAGQFHLYGKGESWDEAFDDAARAGHKLERVSPPS